MRTPSQYSTTPVVRGSYWSLHPIFAPSRSRLRNWACKRVCHTECETLLPSSHVRRIVKPATHATAALHGAAKKPSRRPHYDSKVTTIPQYSIMLIDFQKFSTLAFSSKCVIKSPLTISTLDVMLHCPARRVILIPRLHYTTGCQTDRLYRVDGMRCATCPPVPR